MKTEMSTPHAQLNATLANTRLELAAQTHETAALTSRCHELEGLQQVPHEELQLLKQQHLTEVCCVSCVNTATHCSTLQHTAAHCNTLQHIVTHGR